MGGINLIFHLASLGAVLVFLWWAAHLLRQLRILRAVLQGPSGRLVAMEPVEFAVRLAQSLGKPSSVIGNTREQLQPLKPRELNYVLQHLEISSLEARLVDPRVGSTDPTSIKSKADLIAQNGPQSVTRSDQARWCLTWIGRYEKGREADIKAALERTFGMTLDHELRVTA